ncbi:MAG: hypothetical protein ACKOWF_06240, partial [Chloroflexota bacterium]
PAPARGARERESDLAALAAALPVIERAADGLRERLPAAPLPAGDGDPWEESHAPPGLRAGGG